MSTYRHGDEVRTRRGDLPGAYVLLDLAPAYASRSGTGRRWWLQDAETGAIGHDLAAAESEIARD